MTRALEVARAALLEVGAPPEWVWTRGDALYYQAGSTTAYRACVLGEAAECGPDSLGECWDCGIARRGPCTPLRDLLRGARCGR